MRPSVEADLKFKEYQLHFTFFFSPKTRALAILPRMQLFSLLPSRRWGFVWSYWQNGAIRSDLPVTFHCLAHVQTDSTNCFPSDSSRDFAAEFQIDFIRHCLLVMQFESCRRHLKASNRDKDLEGLFLNSHPLYFFLSSSKLPTDQV